MLKSCPIIGTRFRASGGLLPSIFAAALANHLSKSSFSETDQELLADAGAGPNR